jgi:hypothetical protein
LFFHAKYTRMCSQESNPQPYPSHGPFYYLSYKTLHTKFYSLGSLFATINWVLNDFDSNVVNCQLQTFRSHGVLYLFVQEGLTIQTIL